MRWRQRKCGPIVGRAAEGGGGNFAKLGREVIPDFWRVEETLGTAAKQTEPLLTWAGVVSTVVVAVAYFFAARLSLALLEPVDGVAVFWPAAGVASGILIALGSPARWIVVVGVVASTIVANLLGDRNIWSSVFFAVANAG